jgi:hypothetical protein
VWRSEDTGCGVKRHLRKRDRLKRASTAARTSGPPVLSAAPAPPRFRARKSSRDWRGMYADSAPTGLCAGRLKGVLLSVFLHVAIAIAS